MALQRYDDWVDQLERQYGIGDTVVGLPKPLQPTSSKKKQNLTSKHASYRRAPYTRHMQPGSVPSLDTGILPRHIVLLANLPEETNEVASSYYKRNHETRKEMLERLLNPVLSLEEAARLLGVCPASVRRYTDRGLLTHHRTEGNQRRFHLADVVAFIQTRDQAEENN